MAIKDWKKIYEYQWKHKKIERLFISIDTGAPYHPSKTGKYRVIVYDGVKKEPKVYELFKTKALALKYAKVYMRKH